MTNKSIPPEDLRLMIALKDYLLDKIKAFKAKHPITDELAFITLVSMGEALQENIPGFREQIEINRAKHRNKQHDQ